MTVAFEEWSAGAEWTPALRAVADTSQSSRGWLYTPAELRYVVIACGSGVATSRRERKPDARTQPRTKLGERLWAARARIVAEGGADLNREGVEREVRERRGERAASPAGGEGDEAGA
jgi:hypothetical protein